MKIKIEIKRTDDGYIYKEGKKEVFEKTLEAISRHVTNEIIRRCYLKMTDIPIDQIYIHTQIVLPGSEFQDADECSYHYLKEEKS